MDEEKLSHILFEGEHLTECLWWCLGHLAQEMATLIVAADRERTRLKCNFAEEKACSGSADQRRGRKQLDRMKAENTDLESHPLDRDL